MAYPILRVTPESAVFSATKQAAVDLSQESSRTTNGWNPLLGGAVTALEDAVRSVRKSVGRAFAGRVLSDRGPRQFVDLVDAGLDVAAAYAERLRALLQLPATDSANGERMVEIERFNADVMWVREAELAVVDDSDLVVALEADAHVRGIPVELVWAYVDLHDATAHAERAFRDTVRFRPLWEVVHEAQLSVEFSARAREHAAIARVRDDARREIDESSAAMLRRIRWAVSNGRPVRGNPSTPARRGSRAAR